MNLGELVDELRDNILHDRSDRVAGADDYLWSTATLIRYINEAQSRFAREGLVIRDGTTPEVTRVVLRTGVTQYTLHKSVLATVSAKFTGDVGDLTRVGHSSLDIYRRPDVSFIDPAEAASLPPGKPVAYATDEFVTADDAGSMGVVSFRVYPAPSATYDGDVIRLRVVRGPLEKFIETNLNAVPDIPEEHHLEMLDWAAHLALRIVDVDGGNIGRSDKFKDSFNENVRKARNNAMRKMFAPTGWAFGQNGFSWEK